MIKAKFTGPTGQEFKTKLPCHSLSLGAELAKIGLKMPLRFVKLAENAPLVQMEFTPKGPAAAHLLQAISRQGTLEDLNSATLAVSHADKQIKPQLEQAILRDEYPSLESLLDGIHQLTYDAGAVSETYVFPLTGRVWQEEFGEEMPVSDRFLLGQAEQIQEHFAVYTSRDVENMAHYYKGPGKNKLLLADWGFEELDGTLYGKVDVRLTEPMTKDEANELKDWIRGQNSDGLGEGYEQREIPTEEGGLCVSFRHSGDDYFIYDWEEMEQHLAQSYGQEFGGM